MVRSSELGGRRSAGTVAWSCTQNGTGVRASRSSRIGSSSTSDSGLSSSDSSSASDTSDSLDLSLATSS